MREVGILEAKTHLSALVEAVEKGGEDIHITRHGRRVARLTGEFQVSKDEERQRLSGEELVRRSRAFREWLSAENPEIDKITWEELKRDMRR